MKQVLKDKKHSSRKLLTKVKTNKDNNNRKSTNNTLDNNNINLTNTKIKQSKTQIQVDEPFTTNIPTFNIDKTSKISKTNNLGNLGSLGNVCLSADRKESTKIIKSEKGQYS